MVISARQENNAGEGDKEWPRRKELKTQMGWSHLKDLIKVWKGGLSMPSGKSTLGRGNNKNSVRWEQA